MLFNKDNLSKHKNSMRISGIMILYYTYGLQESWRFDHLTNLTERSINSRAQIKTTPTVSGNTHCISACCTARDPATLMMELLGAFSVLLCTGPVLVQSQRRLEDGIANC